MFIVQDFVMIFNNSIHIYNLFYIIYVRLHVFVPEINLFVFVFLPERPS